MNSKYIRETLHENGFPEEYIDKVIDHKKWSPEVVERFVDEYESLSMRLKNIMNWICDPKHQRPCDKHHGATLVKNLNWGRPDGLLMDAKCYESLLNDIFVDNYYNGPLNTVANLLDRLEIRLLQECTKERLTDHGISPECAAKLVDGKNLPYGEYLANVLRYYNQEIRHYLEDGNKNSVSSAIDKLYDLRLQMVMDGAQNPCRNECIAYVDNIIEHVKETKRRVIKEG